MRTNGERTKMILKRACELRRKRELKRIRRIEICFSSGVVAAGICILCEICRRMPDTVEKVFHGQGMQLYGTAAILGTNEAIGYILTAIFAFTLGACVTLILYLIHRRATVERSIKSKMTEDEQKK